MRIFWKILIGFVSLYLLVGVWTLIMPIKNHALDVFILAKIRSSPLDKKDIIKSLESKGILKAVTAATFDENKVLIYNATNESLSFVVICHVDFWYSIDKGALVLYESRKIEQLKKWKDLIGNKQGLEFYEVILR